MDSTIKDLYYKYSNETMTMKDHPEYKELCKKEMLVLGEIKRSVSDDAYKTMLNLLEIQDEISALEVMNSFQQGFKTGSLMMIEILTDKNFN